MIGILALLKPLPFLDFILAKAVPILRRGEEAKRTRDAYIASRIKATQEQIENGIHSPDMICFMLNEFDEIEQPKFSLDEIKSNVYTFLFAGHETTSTTLQWVLYFLGEFPEWRERINDEFTELGHRINMRTLKHASQTEAFIKEVLRISHLVSNINQRETTVWLPVI